MKIESVRIQNLRSIQDETVYLNDYTCLVGPNGAGKSNVICALNVFFRENSQCPTDLTKLDEEDFYRKQTEEPVRVTLTFTGLSEAARADFAHYYRQGKLILSAEARFDPSTGRAEVKQFGQRMVMGDFRAFFEAYDNKAGVEDLRKIYQSIRSTYPSLEDIKTREGMRNAVRAFEEANPDKCELVPSEDQLYGVSRGKNLLEKYVEWIYVPAVKDVTAEQSEASNTVLGKLVARVVLAKADLKGQVGKFRDEWRAEYRKFLDENKDALKALSDRLAERIAEWSHPDAAVELQWASDEKSVQVGDPVAEALMREGAFQGRLARFGHGLQRCYLFAILQELADSDSEGSPTLLLACEEPELYQHPPQSRHLAAVLQRLSKGNSEVLLSTHSPHFVSGRGFEDVRLVRKIDGRSRALTATHEDVGRAVGAALGEDPIPASGMKAKIHQALQPDLNEMFFARCVVFVEGISDVAYLTTYLNLLGLWDDYRKHGCHMIPTDRKSHMVQPLAVAKCLGIPAYTVFDADFHKVEKSKPGDDSIRKQHERDNRALLFLSGLKEATPFPPQVLWKPHLTVWPTELNLVVKDEIGNDQWHEFSQVVDKGYDQVGGLQKNVLHIADVLELAWQEGRVSDSLKILCERIVDFAESA